MALAQTTIDIPNGRTHYELHRGEEPVPVILVHGFSTPMWVWDKLYAALVDAGRTVLRFDLHGRGHSERASAEDSLELFHQQIDSLRGEFGLETPIDLVGLSMGGAISSSYTARYPDRVRRLVLIAPFNSARKIYLMNWPGIGELFAKHIFVPVGQHWGYRRNLANPERFFAANPEVLALFEARQSPPEHALALLSSLRNIISHDHLPAYRTVGEQGTPTFLVWGEGDLVLPFSESKAVREALGDPAFLALPDTGHLPQLENPGASVPPIVDFLSR